MQNSDSIVITSTDVELLESLSEWLIGEFETAPVLASLDPKVMSLGGAGRMAVVLSSVKDNFKKLVTLVKNWAANYNNDIEITFEYGEKKAMLKCPANRVSDDQIEAVLSTLTNFYN